MREATRDFAGYLPRDGTWAGLSWQYRGERFVLVLIVESGRAE
jgi:hypothetical protein